MDLRNRFGLMGIAAAAAMLLAACSGLPSGGSHLPVAPAMAQRHTQDVLGGMGIDGFAAVSVGTAVVAPGPSPSPTATPLISAGLSLGW